MKIKTIAKALLFNTLLFLSFIQAIKSQTGPYYGPITQWTNGAYEIRNTYGSVVVGPQNGGWCHIYSDMPNFIFNKSVWSIPGNFSSYSTSDLSLQTNGTTRLTINNSTGNVGIGTTTPSYQLHVNSSTNGWTSIIENQGCKIYSVYGNGSNDGYGMHIRLNNSRSDRYAFQIYDGTNFLFNVNNDGKIGIGTNSPQEKLHINSGALKVGNASDATSRALNMIKIGDGNYIQIGEWENDDELSFKANRYSFTNGNVGIGTNNPQSKLSLFNNGRCGIHIDNNSFDWDIEAYNSGVFGGLFFKERNSTFLTFYRDGGAEFATGSLYVVSKNITSEFPTDYSKSFQISVENPDLVLGYITNGQTKFKFDQNGNLALGCTDTKGYKLAVAGTMVAEKVVVKLQANWPDFVFDNNYKKLSLPEIESYISEHKHLPGVPNEASVKETGIDVAEMNALLLKKIEEMTLLMIEQEKKMEKMSKEIEELKGER